MAKKFNSPYLPTYRYSPSSAKRTAKFSTLHTRGFNHAKLDRLWFLIVRLGRLWFFIGNLDRFMVFNR